MRPESAEKERGEIGAEIEVATDQNTRGCCGIPAQALFIESRFNVTVDVILGPGSSLGRDWSIKRLE